MEIFTGVKTITFFYIFACINLKETWEIVHLYIIGSITTCEMHNVIKKAFDVLNQFLLKSLSCFQKHLTRKKVLDKVRERLDGTWCVCVCV